MSEPCDECRTTPGASSASGQGRRAAVGTLTLFGADALILPTGLLTAASGWVILQLAGTTAFILVALLLAASTAPRSVACRS